MSDEVTGKAKGGKARAEVLTPERRKEIAREGARARWSEPTLPTYRATHLGQLKIGNIDCAVLEDKTRVLTRATFVKAIGRTGKAKGGRAYDDEFKLPVFLTAKNLEPFISNDLLENSKPMIYKYKKQQFIGYKAILLPQVCGVFIDADEAGVLTAAQKPIAKQCRILLRGFATVGIIALVDEATGFDKDKARDEYAKILEAFVAKELQPYIKTFQYDYYEQLFRLRGLKFPENGVKRPQYFGHLTNDIIYRRLAPGVWKELKEQTEKNEKGKLKHKLFQKLTPDIGHPKLRDLLASVITIMKLSDQWDDFKNKLNRIHPAYNETMMLPFELENDNGKGF